MQLVFLLRASVSVLTAEVSTILSSHVLCVDGMDGGKAISITRQRRPSRFQASILFPVNGRHFDALEKVAIEVHQD
ncbi:hypothetical protein CEXT_335561 [Caerostris extrusa]|uniref:Secreted protein n=1 Tax=Caerostris extrusa TaxID=172846 RepID=A0AAV4MM31_CAEEX|nr:hypothetical protein CEXT_335561 [Caerostris extrusa]